MARPRNPKRDKAFELYKESNGAIPLIEIAEQLEVSDGTVRGWKSKDDWDNKLNGAFQTKSNRNGTNNTERSKQNEKVSSIEQNNKNNIYNTNNKGQGDNRKTNSPSPFARFGNKNALGNKGGKGGPTRNKHALKTGEFESIYFDCLDEDEKEILNYSEFFENKISMQINTLKLLTMRERKIMKRIKELENTPGGMVIESVTKTKGNLSNNNQINKDDDKEDFYQEANNQSTVAKPVDKQIIILEEALTRVQARKQRAIEVLHRMEIDDAKIAMELEKLELYKQKLTGVVDLDMLIDDEDIDGLLNDMTDDT